MLIPFEVPADADFVYMQEATCNTVDKHTLIQQLGLILRRNKCYRKIESTKDLSVNESFKSTIYDNERYKTYIGLVMQPYDSHEPAMIKVGMTSQPIKKRISTLQSQSRNGGVVYLLDVHEHPSRLAAEWCENLLRAYFLTQPKVEGANCVSQHGTDYISGVIYSNPFDNYLFKHMYESFIDNTLFTKE